MSNISISNLSSNDAENLLVPVDNKTENLIRTAVFRSLEARKIIGAGGTPIIIDGGFTVGLVGFPSPPLV